MFSNIIGCIKYQGAIAFYLVKTEIPYDLQNSCEATLKQIEAVSRDTLNTHTHIYVYIYKLYVYIYNCTLEGWNYLFIHKLKRLYRWSFGMNNQFRTTPYNRYNHLPMVLLKLVKVGFEAFNGYPAYTSRNEIYKSQPIIVVYRLIIWQWHFHFWVLK